MNVVVLIEGRMNEATSSLTQGAEYLDSTFNLSYLIGDQSGIFRVSGFDGTAKYQFMQWRDHLGEPPLSFLLQHRLGGSAWMLNDLRRIDG